MGEIPLKNYQRFLKMQAESNDQEFIAQKMIEIFCGIDLKDVAKIQLTDLNELIDHFNKIFNQPAKFYHRFKIKDMEFGFIPNLEEISWGEYIDLEHHLNNWDEYHKAMAVMYRPIVNTRKDKYEIAPYTASEDCHELMKYMPMEIAISSRVFFYDLGSVLLESTLCFLEREVMKIKRRTSRRGGNSTNNGDGIVASMQWLREIYPDMMKLPAMDYINVSRILPLKNKKRKLSKENYNE